MKLGQFPAYDYFQDGSLYILDGPGHCVGHLCALVRTSVDPDTFVFLGGDAAHHCAEFRPSSYLPLPDSIWPASAGESTSGTRSVSTPLRFEELQKSRGRDTHGPLFQPAFGHNMGQVLKTITKMQEFDGDSSILVIVAHDSAFRSPEIPKFPSTINSWKAEGLRELLRWKWIAEM